MSTKKITTVQHEQNRDPKKGPTPRNKVGNFGGGTSVGMKGKLVTAAGALGTKTAEVME